LLSIRLFNLFEDDCGYNMSETCGQIFTTPIVSVSRRVGWLLSAPPLAQSLQEVVQKIAQFLMARNDVIPSFFSQVDFVTVPIIHNPLLTGRHGLNRLEEWNESGSIIDATGLRVKL
jgi:hypothetical protein